MRLHITPQLVRRVSFTITLLLLIGLWFSGAQTNNRIIRAGTISERVPFVEFPITVTAATRTIVADMRTRGGDLDGFLYLLDANGSILAQDDDRADGNRDPLLTYSNARPGNYTIIATRFQVTEGDTTGDYTITIHLETPTRGETFDYDVSEAAIRAAGFPDQAVAQPSRWAIFAYYGGDTNLEEGVLNDFDEFERSGGSDDSVRIVGLLDRSPGYSEISGDWKTARLFEVGANRAESIIDSEPLADLGALNMADGQTFAQFLVWSARHYPAEQYALAFASHGAAWQGIISDDSNDEDILTLPELDAALRVAREATGIEQFDLLINDACSMSSAEYYAIMKEHFGFSLASPEIVVTPALDMQLFTERLKGFTEIPLASLSQQVIDTYLLRDALDRPGNETAYVNFAAHDLHTWERVTAATEAFAEYILADPFAHVDLIGAARASTYTYSAFLGENDLIDLGDFMHQMRVLSRDPELNARALDVISTLEEASVYGAAAARVRETASLVNVYFPQRGRSFDTRYLDESPLQSWGQMLRAYYNATTPQLWNQTNSLLAFHPPTSPVVKVVQVYPETSTVQYPPAVSVEVAGRRIVDGAFTIDRVEADGTRVRLTETSIVTPILRDGEAQYVNHWRSGVDQSIFNWLPFTLPRITDGNVSANELVTVRDDVLALEGQYRLDESADWNEVTVLFGPDGTVQNVISETPRGGFASITIPTGAFFQTVRFSVTADGDTKREPGTTYVWGAEGVALSNQTVADGRYELGFLVEGFGGIRGFDSVSVDVATGAVDATEDDTSWVGHTDLTLGLNFQHPADWSPVLDFGNQLVTTSPDGNTALRVYYVDAPNRLSSIEAAVSERNDLYPHTYETITLSNGSEALQYDYHFFTDETQVWHGRGIALHRQTGIGAQGIVFAVETAANAANTTPADLLPQFLDRLRFFPAAQLLANASDQWHYDSLNDGRIVYPVPDNWLRVDADGWRVYRERGAFEGQTLVAVAQLNVPSAEAVLIRLVQQYAPTAGSNQITTRVYESENHTWFAAQYLERRTIVVPDRGHVRSTRVAGRIYVTEVNNRVYALRVETPNDDSATDVYRRVFEPMVDGFAPSAQRDFTGTANRSTFVRAALVSAIDLCAHAAYGRLCHANGESVVAVGADDRLASFAGDNTVNLVGLRGIQVGLIPDATDDDAVNIDPFSIAVLKTGTPMHPGPDVVLFGGVTAINRALTESKAVASYPASNQNTVALPIRQFPFAQSPALAQVPPGATIEVLARDPFNSHGRVRLPEDPTRTGWVPLANLAFSHPDADPQRLPVSDFNLAYYDDLQALDIYFDAQASEQTLLYGVALFNSSTEHSQSVRIHDREYTLPPDTLAFWRGADAPLEIVDAVERRNVFETSFNRRLPQTLTIAGFSEQNRTRIEALRTAKPTVEGTAFMVDGRLIDFAPTSARDEMLWDNPASQTGNSNPSEGREATGLSDLPFDAVSRSDLNAGATPAEDEERAPALPFLVQPREATPPPVAD